MACVEFRGEFGGNVVSCLVVVEGDDNGGLPSIDLSKQFTVTVADTGQADGRNPQTAKGGGVEGSFRDRDDVVVEGVDVEDSDRRALRIVIAPCGVGVDTPRGVTANAAVFPIAGRQDDLIADGIEADPQPFESRQIIDGEAALKKVFAASRLVEGARADFDHRGDSTEIDGRLRLVNIAETSARSRNRAANDFDSAVDSHLRLWVKPFDFRNDVDEIAVKTTAETIHGVIVGIELHRRGLVRVRFANAVQLSVAVRLMPHRRKVFAEPSFSGIECGAILLDCLVVFCHNTITILSNIIIHSKAPIGLKECPLGLLLCQGSYINGRRCSTVLDKKYAPIVDRAKINGIVDTIILADVFFDVLNARDVILVDVDDRHAIAVSVEIGLANDGVTNELPHPVSSREDNFDVRIVVGVLGEIDRLASIRFS